MDQRNNQDRFERLMGAVKRNGIDDLMKYITKQSDFYTAPASTKFHLSCEGGLLQHSLNVYDALMSRVERLDPEGKPDEFTFSVNGEPVATYTHETIILVSLLHDLCKTRFYTTEYRNQKIYRENGSKKDNGGRFDWESVPVYAVSDTMPYGHGEKSAMMVSSFIHLSAQEMYAIRWHMGMANESYNNIQSFNASVDKYPLVLLLHNADQEASHFMEDTSGNKAAFADQSAGAYADNPAAEEAQEPVFMEAATY